MKQYSKKRKKRLDRIVTLATDVLYTTMVSYHNEHKICLQYMIDLVKEKNTNLPQLKQLYMLMNKAGEVAIDCAHKLAPYQSPKLESIEVKSTVENRYVIRTPEKAKSVEEWAKMTGATFMDHDPNAKKEQTIQEPVPSIHDFDEEADEVETQKRLYN